MSSSDDNFQFPSFDDIKSSHGSVDKQSDDQADFQVLDFEKSENTSLQQSQKEDVYRFLSFDEVSAQLDSCALPEEKAIQAELTQRLKAADEKLEAAEEKFKQADQAIEDAKTKAIEIEKQAHEKGIEEGRTEGRESVISQSSIVIEGIEKVLKEITAYKDDFPKIYEREVVGLIKEIAKKVVHVEAKIDDRVILKNIYKAFEILSDRVEVKLNINPEDLDFVNENRPEFFSNVKGLQSISIEADSDVERGGCFIETEYGNVDARIQTQLERVESSLEELLKNA
ncbi:MAG: flagellar assembly protein FliH [Candidatus Magnetoglobus multicellularis str. Araruama]|uniref:Flagellar assembly protein FliH n=1 Tax=Candidatus Magnetoglobus multicellularis str. Araruama TaxID=890399 RepID=A0A1V1PHA0_9BACT|nr:MAG: flagellar assembly protein FliH [Candidatus Magnetoglobus multicellularis str. Araruama]